MKQRIMDLRIFGRAFEKELRPIFFLSTSIVRATGVDYYRFDPLCFKSFRGFAGALLKDSELACQNTENIGETVSS